jgi:hypothetical protein
MVDQPILTTRIDCLSSDGERQEVAVEIGRPYKAPEGEWACPVKIRGMYDRLPDVRGEDSLQALCLAASLVRSLLTSFVEAGGRLVTPNTDSAYELKATFGEIGNPPSDQRA